MFTSPLKRKRLTRNSRPRTSLTCILSLRLRRVRLSTTLRLLPLTSLASATPSTSLVTPLSSRLRLTHSSLSPLPEFGVSQRRLVVKSSDGPTSTRLSSSRLPSNLRTRLEFLTTIWLTSLGSLVTASPLLTFLFSCLLLSPARLSLVKNSAEPFLTSTTGSRRWLPFLPSLPVPVMSELPPLLSSSRMTLPFSPLLRLPSLLLLLLLPRLLSLRRKRPPLMMTIWIFSVMMMRTLLPLLPLLRLPRPRLSLRRSPRRLLLRSHSFFSRSNLGVRKLTLMKWLLKFLSLSKTVFSGRLNTRRSLLLLESTS
mmetsp:Transcript_65577/g.90668  ORF Transcript_65577/g.90668 Transcript_65577/m.90668 type:complete len:311 (-) Transcript_65577:181-1113(-)